MDSIVHFEIPVDDLGKAKTFYAQAFGWQLSEDKMPDGSTYTAAVTTPTDENHAPLKNGAINGALIKKEAALNTPLVSVSVASVADSIQKVVDAGGTIVKPQGEIPGMGEWAYVADPEGNLIGLWHQF